MLFEIALWFIPVWIFAFIMHEIGHSIEAKAQGCHSYIYYTKFHGIPSLHIGWNGQLTDKWRFDIAGGLISCFFCYMFVLLFNLVNYQPLVICFSILGTINLVYALYEALYINSWSYEKYMIRHYFLYGIVGIPMVIYYLWR